MRKGYTVCVSDEARREVAARREPGRKKSACPACEIRARKGAANVPPPAKDGAGETKSGEGKGES